MRIAAPIIAAFLALATSGCIYKLDVQQGNVVTQESASKLKKGMTKSEVRQLLGTPLLMDPFHGNRWDYFFSTEVRGKLVERNKLSVFFENDKLVSLAGDIKPAAPAPGASAPAAAATPAATAPAKPASSANTATK